MEIKSLSYRRAFNLGNYESETIEAVAEVGADEAPEVALYALRQWVAAQAGRGGIAQPPAAEAAKPRLATPPAPVGAGPGDAPATPAQVNAVYAIGRREFHWTEDDVDAHCRATFGKAAGDLSKREASELIDRMKTNPASLR